MAPSSSVFSSNRPEKSAPNVATVVSYRVPPTFRQTLRLAAARSTASLVRSTSKFARSSASAARKAAHSAVHETQAETGGEDDMLTICEECVGV
eukprot:scaffold65057_cov37-Tisochrysis_lutea.AAC.4